MPLVCCLSIQAVEKNIELPVVRNATTLMWCHYDEHEHDVFGSNNTCVS